MRFVESKEDLDWEDWDLSKWNNALFRHFFRDDTCDGMPVSRLVLNAETLQKITGDIDGNSKDFLSAFRLAVLGRLRRTGRTLCTDAVRSEWETVLGSSIPQYFSHLAVTLLAASGTSESTVPMKDFRKRLNRFLGRGENNARYNLGDLPRLWEMLESWLNKAADAGKPYRRIILRQQRASLRLIGYSIDLSFPSHRDQRVLIQLFHGRGFSSPTPAILVLREIEGALHRFGDRFRLEFYRFYQAFLAGDTELYQRSFWSAVRDALKIASERSQPNVGELSPQALLVLERDIDWQFTVTALFDSALPAVLPHGLAVVPVTEFAKGEFRFILSRTDESADGMSAGALLMSGSLENTSLYGPGKNALSAINQGFILFSADEEGQWLAVTSMPYGEALRALVRDDIIEQVLECVGDQARSCPSRYTGWHELDELSSDGLLQSGISERFPSIRCLQQVIDAPRLVVRNGIRLPNGWLGMHDALPEVVLTRLAEAAVVDIMPHPNNESLEPVNLRRQAGCFTIPVATHLPVDLDGQFLIKARSANAVIATRTVDFRSHVLSFDFKAPSSLDNWMTEAGRSDFQSLTNKGPMPDEVSRAVSGASSDLLRADELPSGTFGKQGAKTESLVEAVAGLALRRQLIKAADVAEWFSRILGIKGKRLWAVIRCWEEAGYLDALSFRRWSARGYIARRPHFIVSTRSTSPNVIAVLQGLTPASLLRAINEVATNLGLMVQRFPSTEMVPNPIIVRAGEREAIDALSLKVGLERSHELVPIKDCVLPVNDISTIESVLRKNHQLLGHWDWERGTFSNYKPATGVVVERYHRDEVPDAYLVRSGENVLWHSLSRTWAILVGLHHRRDRGFSERGIHVLESRYPCVNLPIPFGRWCTAASGVAPQLDAEGRFSYTFPSEQCRRDAISALWPKNPSDFLHARARQLDRLVLVRNGRFGEPIPVPSWVKNTLELHADRLMCKRLIQAIHVPRNLMPRVIALARELQQQLNGIDVNADRH
jgi:hypothetical protein